MVRLAAVGALLAALVTGGFLLGAWLAPAPGPPSGAGVGSPVARDHLFGFRSSVVATVRGRSADVFHRPGQRRPWRTLANPTADGTSLLFLVRGRRAGWLKVALPVRPNGSTGWIRDSAVRLAENDFRLKVDLSRHRLALWRGRRVVQRSRVGVGRSVTPTPTGSYGPYAFAISAYSPVLTHFGGGAGQVGIHGTNDPAGVGRDVSHGCIRLRNTAIMRLARVLPLGTPVAITR